MEDQERIWRAMRGELAANGLMLLDAKDISAAHRPAVGENFLSRIFPVLTPLAIDPAHPFPFIPNLGFSLALKLVRRRDGKNVMALLPVPPQLQRFWRLPNIEKSARFLPLE